MPKSENATQAIPTLEDIGVDKKQSSKWQNLAAIPEKEFEQKVESQNGTPLLPSLEDFGVDKNKSSRTA